MSLWMVTKLSLWMVTKIIAYMVSKHAQRSYEVPPRVSGWVLRSLTHASQTPLPRGGTDDLMGPRHDLLRARPTVIARAAHRLPFKNPSSLGVSALGMSAGVEQCTLFEERPVSIEPVFCLKNEK